MELQDGERTAKVNPSQSRVLTERREIDIRVLKGFVAAKFGSRSLLGKVMLVEPDLIPAADIVGKVGTWLAVLREGLEDRP